MGLCLNDLYLCYGLSKTKKDNMFVYTGYLLGGLVLKKKSLLGVVISARLPDVYSCLFNKICVSRSTKHYTKSKEDDKKTFHKRK